MIFENTRLYPTLRLCYCIFQQLNPITPDETYYIQSYQYIAYLVNQCFQQCLTDLNAQMQTPVTTTAPKMSYKNQLFSIALDSQYYGSGEPNKIDIYFNSASVTNIT